MCKLIRLLNIKAFSGLLNLGSWEFAHLKKRMPHVKKRRPYNKKRIPHLKKNLFLAY